MRTMTIGTSLLAVVLGCRATPVTLDPAHAAAMRDSVTQMAAAIAQDLARAGPSAWLQYFEDTPAFFMASDGQMLFPTRDSADILVGGLATRISQIVLDWQDIRVEPIAPGLAVMAAPYHEVVTDTAGAQTSFGGFFTGLATHSTVGWQLRNLHWSSPVPAQ
ncbi:MAG: hypothetical protein AMS18_14960 [Gemmatimonas sp. SG8_17]|nr:MAG: hypothetical protein AMS18_14960 [Gemmatimonas sp. SG8_17]